jgi:hypothetical protein
VWYVRRPSSLGRFWFADRIGKRTLVDKADGDHVAGQKPANAFRNDLDSIFYAYSVEGDTLVITPQSLYFERLKSGRLLLPQNTELNEESPIVAMRGNNPTGQRVARELILR